MKTALLFLMIILYPPWGWTMPWIYLYLLITEPRHE